jgi:hypothetical protein
MIEHTAGDRTPFTYVIKCLTTNQIYYGVRYAKRCHPSDLGKKYFSSSTVLNRRIKQYGLQQFQFQVRRIFSSQEAACAWELKVLRRIGAASNPLFINRQNHLFPVDNRGSKNPMYGLPGTMLGRKHSEETKAKQRATKLGNTWNTGKNNSAESKRKCSESQQGSKSHAFRGFYHTPHGIFESRRLAATTAISGKCIQNWCTSPDRKISRRALTYSAWLKPDHLGKTYRELGFWFEPA